MIEKIDIIENSCFRFQETSFILYYYSFILYYYFNILYYMYIIILSEVK